MQADLVFVMLVFSLLAIIFVISKLNRAVKLLNNRLNIHSDVLKRLKKDGKGDSNEMEELLKKTLDREFK